MYWAKAYLGPWQHVFSESGAVFPTNSIKSLGNCRFWYQNKSRVACRGGLRREILVKNVILNFESAGLANNDILCAKIAKNRGRLPTGINGAPSGSHMAPQEGII